MSSALTVLSAHNFYQQPGGEDVVYAAEAALLREHGHVVTTYERNNAQIRSGSSAAVQAVWSARSRGEIGTRLGSQPVEVAHFHNTFPLISPSAYYAAASRGAAVVQTLHNYRLICPGALLAREGTPCEECITQRSLRPAVAHGCYRGSRAGTASVAAMLGVHRAMGTYRYAVDAYIALSEFARGKFIEGGLPAERIWVKPNFVADPCLSGGLTGGIGEGDGGYALFAGRLSAEKGIATLIEAWAADARGSLADVPLRVAGAGPLEQARWPDGVTTLGQVRRDEVLALLRRAVVLIYPSVCFENAPMTILEAFACGTPVIASDLGAMAELVRHGYNGLLFRAGDARDLAGQVRYAFTHPEHVAEMRQNARREYEEKYTPESNYRQLIAIYERAMENARRRRAA